MRFHSAFPPGASRWLAGCLVALIAIAPCSTTNAATHAATHGHATKKPSKAKTRPAERAQPVYGSNETAMRFAAALDEQEGWSDDWAQRWIARAQYNPSVVRLMLPAPAGTPKNWAAYRDRFIEPRRLQAGLRFWQSHADALQRAEAEYGVPAWLIVGIIGVETLYGQHTGNYRALDALATLAFDFPAEHPRAQQRSTFFQSELAALLRLARQEGVAPDEWRGSYAGAMGLPQFMPSNWSKLGVDFDRDGHIDLLGSPGDAIASVARYLQSHGWRPGMPTHYAVNVSNASAGMAELLAPDILPTFSAERMQALGAELEATARAHAGPLALVELQNGTQPPSYVAGTENFYVVTRYNWSSYYALAVIELGQAVQALLPR